MECKALMGDKYIKDWLSGIGAKSKTKSTYIDCIRSYTEFLRKAPEQIILESEADIKSGKLMRERVIFDDLRDYREYLENQDLAPLTIKQRLTGVRSFFNFYNIQLPVLPRSATNAVSLLENREIPKKEDIQEIISICDPLEKALVLCGVSSGLAINEISELQVQEFLDGYDPDTQITTLHLIRAKVGYEFYTFLTPEASKAIWNYLNWRERISERHDKYRQDQLLKQRIEYDRNGKATGYLFVNRYISPDYFKVNIKQAEEIRKLTTNNIQQIYRELNEKAGKSNTLGKRNIFRSHNMRKFFNSTLLANGCDIFTTDFFMGHKIDSTRDAYFRADPKTLREKYKNFIPYLTIQKELNVSESPEYQKLKNENEIYIREAAKATVERAEIQRINSEFENYKIQSEIRIVEMEMNAKIQPYQFQIEKDQEEVESLKLTITLPSVDNHGYAKARIKELEAEILRFTEKINLIKSEFQEKINLLNR